MQHISNETQAGLWVISWCIGFVSMLYQHIEKSMVGSLYTKTRYEHLIHFKPWHAVPKICFNSYCSFQILHLKWACLKNIPELFGKANQWIWYCPIFNLAVASVVGTMRFISIHFTSLCRNLMQFIYLIFTAPAPAHEISGRMSSQFPNQRSSHLGQWCSPSQDPPSLAQKARLVRSGNGRRVEQLQKVSDCDSKSQLLSRSCRLRRKKD